MLIIFKSLLCILLATNICFADKYVIGCHKDAGLYFNFLGVINNLIWCKKNNLKPVVYWKNSLYYEKNGYQGKDNPWEYYFEPVSNESYSPNDVIHETNRTPDNIMISPTKVHFCDQYADANTRKSVHSVIKEFIKLRPYLEHKIESFFQANMAGKKTIGIHLRGTDKKVEVKQVDTDAILIEANEFAKQLPDCQFFVATDEEKLLQRAKEKLRGKIVYYDSYRSTTGQPIHRSGSRKGRAKIGEDVVVEANLLARCDLFLHTCSSVSTAVLFLNPNLEHKHYKVE